jgi:hypothetical protein
MSGSTTIEVTPNNLKPLSASCEQHLIKSIPVELTSKLKDYQVAYVHWPPALVDINLKHSDLEQLLEEKLKLTKKAIAFHQKTAKKRRSS